MHNAYLMKLWNSFMHRAFFLHLYALSLSAIFTIIFPIALRNIFFSLSNLARSSVSLNASLRVCSRVYKSIRDNARIKIGIQSSI